MDPSLNSTPNPKPKPKPNQVACNVCSAKALLQAGLRSAARFKDETRVRSALAVLMLLEWCVPTCHSAFRQASAMHIYIYTYIHIYPVIWIIAMPHMQACNVHGFLRLCACVCVGLPYARLLLLLLTYSFLLLLLAYSYPYSYPYSYTYSCSYSYSYSYSYSFSYSYSYSYSFTGKPRQ